MVNVMFNVIVTFCLLLIVISFVVSQSIIVNNYESNIFLDVLKGGNKDVLKLDKLSLKIFEAAKKYHGLNDKRLKLLKGKKFCEAAKIQNQGSRLFIKLCEAEINYQQAQIDLVDMKKLLVRAKKKELQAQKKKKKK